MSRSSARRAQVEPVPALVAVLAVCLALAGYATVQGDVLPASDGHVPADAALADVVDAATPDGSVVISPSKLSGSRAAPAGFEVAVELRAADRTWTAGATDPPPDAASASRRVPVRVAPDHVAPGRIAVEVWR